MAIAPKPNTRRINVDFLGESFDFCLYEKNDVMCGFIREAGYFSRNDLMIMRNLLKPGDVFIDIGANIGWHSSFASRWVGLNGRVFAFEPEQSNFSILSDNFSTFPAKNGQAFKLATLAERHNLSLSRTIRLTLISHKMAHELLNEQIQIHSLLHWRQK